MELERELDLTGMGEKEGLLVELDTRMESTLASIVVMLVDAGAGAAERGGARWVAEIGSA